MNREEELIAEFVCPGCISGPDPDSCPSYVQRKYDDGFGCLNHTPGTLITIPQRGLVKIALGMPTGFNRVGDQGTAKIDIYIFKEGTFPGLDKVFNIPIWKKFINGFTFVRMYQPRLNNSYVFIFEGNQMEHIDCIEAPDNIE